MKANQFSKLLNMTLSIMGLNCLIQQPGYGNKTIFLITRA